MIGHLSQPWESAPSTIVVGVDRNNPEALWEALQHAQPSQLIVAGAPGNDDRWTAIERHCREHDIAVSYLERETDIALPMLAMTIVPSRAANRDSSPSFVRISSGDVVVGVELGGIPEGSRFHLVGAANTGNLRGPGDVNVVREASDAANEIVLAPGERITVRFEAKRLRLSGGPARHLARD